MYQFDLHGLDGVFYIDGSSCKGGSLPVSQRGMGDISLTTNVFGP